MSFSVDLKTFLQDKTTAAQNVYHDQQPQGATVPYIVITRGTGGSTVPTLRGSAPIQGAVWNIYSFGPTRGTTDDLDLEVRDALEAYGGPMGDSFVYDASLLSAPDTGYDRAQDKRYTPRYWTRSVYMINHTVPEVSR